jgi:hypothetical protein
MGRTVTTAAGKGRLQIEDYDVERVAVLSAGLRDEAEVMREAQPGRESTADAERAESSVVLVLVAASRRGVDHYTDTCGTRVPWRQLIWCRRRLHSATASGRSSRSSWPLRRPARRQCEREMLKGVHDEETFRVRRRSSASRLLNRLRLKGAHSRRGRRRPLSSPAASRCRRALIGREKLWRRGLKRLPPRQAGYQFPRPPIASTAGARVRVRSYPARLRFSDAGLAQW